MRERADSAFLQVRYSMRSSEHIYFFLLVYFTAACYTVLMRALLLSYKRSHPEVTIVIVIGGLIKLSSRSLTSVQALDLWVQIGSPAPITQDGVGEAEPVSMESLQHSLGLSYEHFQKLESRLLSDASESRLPCR